MSDEQSMRPVEQTIYYRGRASGLAPMLRSIKGCLWIVVFLAIYWVLSPDNRESVVTMVDSPGVTEVNQSWTDYEYSRPIAEGVRVFLLICCGIVVLRIMLTWWRWNTMNYTISNQRIVFEYGWLSKTITTVDLWRVRDMVFHRGVLEAMFGIGTIELVATNIAIRHSQIGPIQRGRAVYEQLMEARERAIRERGVTAVET